MSKPIKFIILVLLCTGVMVSVSCAQDTKQPDVSGAFYPSDPKELKQRLKELFERADPQNLDGDIAALVSPHAGYLYSGSVAAYGYKAVKDKSYDTVVILAQSHFHDFEGIAIWPAGEFATPLGNIKIDEVLAKRLISLNPRIKEERSVFTKEHPLEVQLPFLKYALKDFKLIPLIMGRFSLSDCELLAHSLKVILEGKNALIVFSTDLSHFHPYQEAVLKDNRTISYILSKDPKGFYEKTKAKEADLCGIGPILTALYFAKENNLDIKLLKYANSGDATGDLSGVVGYASMAIYKPNPEIRKSEANMLNKAQRKRLLEIARQTIQEYLKSGKILEVSENDAVLNTKKGAFVTLNEHGQLRGCIGNLIGEQPLYLTVRDMSIEAATNDPRFSPVEQPELKDIEIEISVLSELEKVPNADNVQPGKHGVLIRKGFRSGVFLPQVATETGWTKEEFLSNLCVHKAGLDANCWRDGSADIFVFTAEVFNEKEY